MDKEKRKEECISVAEGYKKDYQISGPHDAKTHKFSPQKVNMYAVIYVSYGSGGGNLGVGNNILDIDSTVVNTYRTEESCWAAGDLWVTWIYK